jgi:hypothetical protein
MSKPGTRTTVVPPRPLSPKPHSHGATTSTTNHLKNGSLQPSPPSQPLQVSGSSSRYRSPTRQTLPGQTPSSGLFASPVVTVEPPKSPPKSAPKTLGIHIPPRSPSPLLTGDAMARSGASSPRHSRPHTPLTETSKLARVSMSLPPEPPPPRRSGEMRRETAPKPIMGPPPPVNRAEKPRIPASKPIHSSDTTKLTTSTHRPEDGQTSPFGTPPSEESSPIAEPIPVRAVTHRLNMTQPRSRSTTPIASSEVPPAHKLIVPPSRGPEHGQASKRLSASPQPSGDHVEDRPALPVRPSLNTSISAPMRGNGDGMLFTRTHTTPVKATLSKNGTLTTSQAESVTSGPVLPRRNFSHPNTPAPTTPRTHGRSMTVDQTNDRSLAPLWAEASTHRAPQPDRPVDSRLALAESDSNMVYSSSEYPDSSLSNRRPPHFKSHSQEIATRFDARIFDVCGDFVCTSGQYTRVWGLQDGEQIISLAHGESIKISSLSFKPASNPDEEGFCLWLGNNVGELIEVDIRSQSGIVASNTSSHNRRDIYRIHRNKRELWTLDESGTLHVWSMDDAKASSLESPSASYRIPRGQGFSMVVRDELWHALGFDIRVFAPTSNGKSRFQVLQKPLSRPETGAITAGTTLGSEQQQVYFGHADGKVSIYSSENYSCLGVVVASMYKITALAGVGDFLWAAYPTGLIYVYDTTQRPWVVKKDWRAHLNPVIGLIADRSSFWRLGRSQVISLGADNCLKTWDGLLEDDWLETELHIRDEDFCQLETIKTLVFTWNAGASTPHSLRYADEDRSFFPALLKDSGSPDILVFGFQELVDLEDKKKTAKSIFSKSKKKDPYEQEYMSHQYRDWQDYIIQCLDESIPGDEIYHLLHSTSLVGLFTCVFVRGGLRDRISALSAGEVKRGFGGRAGNKVRIILLLPSSVFGSLTQGRAHSSSDSRLTIPHFASSIVILQLARIRRKSAIQTSLPSSTARSCPSREWKRNDLTATLQAGMDR